MSASSVVIKGIDARTFTEMEGFVKDLEARPVERLLRDLPELAGLSATKDCSMAVVAGSFLPSRRNSPPESSTNEYRFGCAVALPGMKSA